jgi:tripartite-type tricarboxylate transporter receptor subunit TctC
MHRAGRALALFLFCACCSGAHAQGAPGYPTHPLTLILPFAPGSSGDISLRSLTDRMTAFLGQPSIADNVVGAAGLIGAEKGRVAAPDGYTIIGMADSTLILLPLLNKNARFDPLKDFEPIIQVASIDWILVANPTFPGSTLADLIRLAKAQPGKIDYASGGQASPQYVITELFKARAGIDLTHVPYKGATPAMVDVVAGSVPIMFNAIAIASPFLKSGKLKAIATAGRKRSPLFPDVPTMIEAGLPDFEYASWVGLLAPRGTPPAVVTVLHDAAAKALADPAMEARFLANGMTPIGNSSAAFKTNLGHEYKRLADLIKSANLKIE